MKRNLIYHSNITANQSVLIANAAGIDSECQLDAIRRDGATLTCDRKALDSLLPNCMGVAPKQPAALQLSFALDHSNETITANCDVIYVRRISRETYLLELKFTEISDEEFVHIDHFVENAFKSGRKEKLQASALREVA